MPSPKTLCTVAIIGRPNVGKSTLFNRFTTKRKAIVSNTPGVTRDRKMADAQLGDLDFQLIDTAGLEEAENDSLESLMMEQTQAAITEADVIWMVIDGRSGVIPSDRHFVEWVRKSQKPVLLIVNKCEGHKTDDNVLDAYQLGLGDPIAVSAEHGLGLEGLYAAFAPYALHDKDPETEEDEEDPDRLMQVAILGRPNVGKSTFFNQILKEERSIVSDVAGTTRDSVYVPYRYNDTEMELVDTAGIRKKSKTGDKLEHLSVTDSYMAVQYADVVVLMLDATQALEKMDLHLADHVMQEGRALVIAVNKWDLVKHKDALRDELHYKIGKSLSQARGVAMVTLSAKNNKNVSKVMDAVLEMYRIWNIRVPTGKLNRWFETTTSKSPPPLSKNRPVKLRFITQIKTRPPTFSVFTGSNLRDFPESYRRFLINELRKEFDFQGVPIRLVYSEE